MKTDAAQCYGFANAFTFDTGLRHKGIVVLKNLTLAVFFTKPMGSAVISLSLYVYTSFVCDYNKIRSIAARVDDSNDDDAPVEEKNVNNMKKCEVNYVKKFQSWQVQDVGATSQPFQSCGTLRKPKRFSWHNFTQLTW